MSSPKPALQTPGPSWPQKTLTCCTAFSLVRSRFPLGNKGPACRGSGQREAGGPESGRDRERQGGSCGCRGDAPPSPSPHSPFCRFADVGTLRALSWPESKNWAPSVLPGHLAWKAGSSWAGTRPSFRRKVIWCLALGKKALTHSGHEFASSPVVTLFAGRQRFPRNALPGNISLQLTQP